MTNTQQHKETSEMAQATETVKKKSASQGYLTPGAGKRNPVYISKLLTLLREQYPTKHATTVAAAAAMDKYFTEGHPVSAGTLKQQWDRQKQASLWIAMQYENAARLVLNERTGSKYRTLVLAPGETPASTRRNNKLTAVVLAPSVASVPVATAPGSTHTTFLLTVPNDHVNTVQAVVRSLHCTVKQYDANDELNIEDAVAAIDLLREQLTRRNIQ